MTGLRGRSAAGSLAAAATVVAVVTVAARLVGFARVVVFAHTVGPSCLGDTYYTANTVPNILFDVVAGGALSSIAVPLLAGPAEAGDHERADRITSALLSWTLLLLLPVVVVGFVAARPVMDLLVGNGHPGCDAVREQVVGARMLLVFLPQILLYGVGVVFIGALQAQRRFVGPALAPLLSSLVVIASYLTFSAVSGSGDTTLLSLPRSHELILSVGTTLGVAALALPLLWPLRRTGRRLRPTLQFPPGAASTARRMAVAGAVVLGSQDLATGAILRLANDHGDGGAVVLYNLAWTVFLVPWAVLAVPIATTAFPTLSAAWQSGERSRYSRTAAMTTRAVLLATAGAAAVMVAAAGPAARVIVLGAPGGVAPHVLARALVAFAPGLVGYGLVTHVARIHYARGDARTPALATAAGWLLAVIADILLVSALPRGWTAAALGWGTAAGMTLAASWQVAVLARRAGTQALQGVATTLAASVAAAGAAGAAGLALARGLPTGGIASSVGTTAVVAAACLVVYAVVVGLLDRSTLVLVMRRRYAPG